MSSASAAPILALLERHLGLDPESIGKRTVELAVQRRAAAAHLDLETYARALPSAPIELAALVDQIVVPETWFFRDVAPFKLLKRHATAWRARAPLVRPYRVLSAPCSTGEEPYSIAMTLLDAGLSPHQFTVEACDVSERHLAAARVGVYGKNSFRGAAALEAASCKQHFQPAGEDGQLAVTQIVRTSVRWKQVNLVAPGALSDTPPFDVVFCRNLLIYLTREARTRAIAAIDACLTDGGLLFVGHAEALERLDPRYRSTGDTGAFAYTRDAARGKPESAAKPTRAAKSAKTTKPARVGNPPSPKSPRTRRARRAVGPAALSPAAATESARVATAKAAGAKSTPPLTDVLHAAQALADRGRLDEAAALCETTLRDAGPSAALYALHGVVKQAAADLPSAERSFNKALYVDPNHYEALVHLALLVEQRGEHAQAANLLKRARRIAADRAPQGGR